jgi:hypothetical protein
LWPKPAARFAFTERPVLVKADARRYRGNIFLEFTLSFANKQLHADDHWLLLAESSLAPLYASK